MGQSIIVLWDNQAKADLKIIHDFIAIHSRVGAKNVVQDILNQCKKIHFTEQYPVDEILGSPYRKMFVRKYKIIYKVQTETEIRILQLFDTRQNPNLIKK